MEKDNYERIRRHLPDICKHLKPLEILTLLPCLTDMDIQQIQCKVSNDGTSEAARHLIDALRRRANSYEQFLDALMQTKYEYLVEQIDLNYANDYRRRTHQVNVQTPENRTVANSERDIRHLNISGAGNVYVQCGGRNEQIIGASRDVQEEEESSDEMEIIRCDTEENQTSEENNLSIRSHQEESISFAECNLNITDNTAKQDQAKLSNPVEETGLPGHGELIEMMKKNVNDRNDKEEQLHSNKMVGYIEKPALGKDVAVKDENESFEDETLVKSAMGEFHDNEGSVPDFGGIMSPTKAKLPQNVNENDPMDPGLPGNPMANTKKEKTMKDVDRNPAYDSITLVKQRNSAVSKGNHKDMKNDLPTVIIKERDYQQPPILEPPIISLHVEKRINSENQTSSCGTLRETPPKPKPKAANIGKSSDSSQPETRQKGSPKSLSHQAVMAVQDSDRKPSFDTGIEDDDPDSKELHQITTESDEESICLSTDLSYVSEECDEESLEKTKEHVNQKGTERDIIQPHPVTSGNSSTNTNPMQQEPNLKSGEEELTFLRTTNQPAVNKDDAEVKNPYKPTVQGQTVQDVPVEGQVARKRSFEGSMGHNSIDDAERDSQRNTESYTETMTKDSGLPAASVSDQEQHPTSRNLQAGQIHEPPRQRRDIIEKIVIAFVSLIIGVFITKYWE